jgi:predicted TIM-barrel fold metal-dependent hydrolase
MTSRREFLSSAGLAMAQDPRPFVVDCQSHLYVPELIAFMETRKTSPYAYSKGKDTYVVVGKWHRRLQPRHTDAAAKLADVDAAGITVTALSINDPGPELFGTDGPLVARMVNDYIAGVCRRYPGRFIGLAVLPLQDMDAAMSELDRCAGKLGMKGVLLYSNLDGSFPDEPRYRPLFREAERRGLPLLLHPAYPVTYDVTQAYDMTGMVALMFDTSIALCRIILSGLLDEYPKLKLVCPHLGGTLPYLIGRIDHQTQVLKRGAEHITQPPSAYLKHIWLDIVSPLPLAIRYGYDFAGPDRLLYASDHPWVDPKLILSCLREAKLSPADERRILSEIARQLFQL